jgi:hypothetical protein
VEPRKEEEEEEEEKQGEKLWTGFIGLRTETSGGSL